MVMAEFAAIKPLNSEEEEARQALTEELQRFQFSWEYYCGLAEGVNVLTRLYPFSDKDIAYRATARLAIVVTANLALKAIQEEEDIEGFPEEI